MVNKFHITYHNKINLWTAAVSLLESSAAQLRSNEDLEGQIAQTTTRAAVGIAYHLWLPFSNIRVLNLTKFRSITSDQSDGWKNSEILRIKVINVFLVIYIYFDIYRKRF